MAAVERINPDSLFSTDEWRALRQRSAWRGPAQVAHCWGVIALAVAATVWFPHPFIWIAAVMIVGTRQLGLAILMHEAAHHLLHKRPAVNNFFGQWLCAAPVGAQLRAYRIYHLRHHKYAQQAEDPDLPLAQPFPVSRASLARKILRDLTGLTFLKQRVGLLVLRLRGGQVDDSQQTIGGTLEGVPAFLLTNGLLFGLFYALGIGPRFFTVWLLAMATWFPLVTRLRSIAEHACTSTSPDPFVHARTTRANWLARLLIAPYYVNYHVEHHLFMYLPCYRLAELHRQLGDKGLHQRMTLAASYRDVLRLATTV